MSLQTDLRAAADHLEIYGWQQRKIGRTLGPKCVSGAILAVTGSTERWHRAVARLEKRLGVTNMAGWNDTPGRQAREVIDALRKAAV